jgi:hypothetical protein
MALQGAPGAVEGLGSLLDRLVAGLGRRPPADQPEERPDFERTDAMWSRMRELQGEFEAEVRPDSMYRSQYRRAFDIVRESLTRGQASAAELQLDTLDDILARIVESNRQHARETRRG